MLQAYVITLREGLEAFLIVAVSLAYLRRRGARALVLAVYWGIAAAVLVSIAASYLFARAANQSLWEGVLAIGAAIMVTTLTVHMWRAAATIKSDIEDRLAISARRVGPAACLGVFAFTVFMIAREGVETVLLMNALLFQVRSGTVLAGALLGLASAAAVGWLWSRYGRRVNLRLFFQVTAVFLFVFVAQLVVYGFHEFSEARLLPYSEVLHWATEPYGPDGMYGRYLSYLLVAMPLAWLTVASLRPRLAAAAVPDHGRPTTARQPGD